MRAGDPFPHPYSCESRSAGHQTAPLAAWRSCFRRSADRSRHGAFLPLALLPLLTACASQIASGVEPAAPGFLLGLWHGFIFPVAWILSLFVADIAIYAVPNNGGWYDFGYFIGVVFLGVGARSSRTVYRTRVVERPARRGTVIENER